ncbi:MAG: LysR substrate-binding domain-containing protein [Pseudomonadota bacterium]
MVSSPLDRRLVGSFRLRHLEIVAAIYDCGGALKASQRVNITQPAVTKSLQDVENALGVQLFVRSSRGLKPTHFGDVFVRHAKIVLAQLRHSAEEIGNLKDGVGGSATIGTVLAASAQLLPEAVIALKAERPQIGVNILEGTYDVLIPRLRMGDLDLVVGRIPEGPPSDSVVYEPFYREETCLVTRVQHPLAAREKLQLKDLLDEAWLLPVPESHLRRQVDRLFVDANLRLPTNIIESMSALTNRVLLEQSDLIGVLPYHVVQRDVLGGRLVVLPVAMPAAQSQVGAIMRASADLRPSATALLEQLRRVGQTIASEVEAFRQITTSSQTIATARPASPGRPLARR